MSDDRQQTSDEWEAMIKQKRQPIPHPLTREQMFLDTIKALQCLYIAVDEPIAKDVNEKVMSLIESYRNDLTQQAQEIERLNKENASLAAGSCESPYGDDYGNKRCKAIDALRAECRRIECINAQQAQEIERLKKGLESAYALHVDDDNRLFALEQQLAASQQRVRELEQPRLTLAECVVVDYLEKEVDQLLPMLGVEAALITDLSHVGDFPDDRLGAEKYVWQAAIDFLRTQLATLQATLAAREAEFQEAMQQAHRALKGGQ